MLKYIFIVFLFCACNNTSTKDNVVPISTEVLDTIRVFPSSASALPHIFETAFKKGTTQTKANATFNVYGITVGKIKINSGRIIACDPMIMEEYGIAFTQKFPVGEFPVQLSIAQLEGAETIAYIRINFSNEPVVKWEYALLPDQKPIGINDNDYYGYIVDSGMGIFVDEASAKELNKEKLTEMTAEPYKQMDKNYHEGWKYAMHDFGKNNLVVFTAGFGDGRYGTYIGYDAKGTPCRLLTDFGLFDWRKS